MYCYKCGQLVDDNANTCPYCGETLNQNNYFNQQQPNQQYSQPDQQGQYYQQSQYNQYNQYNQPYQPMSKNWMEEISTSKTLGLIAIVISFFMPFLGWVFGGIGLSKANSVPFIPHLEAEKRKARKMNIWGIVIPFIEIAIAVIFYLLIIGIIGFASYY